MSRDWFIGVHRESKDNPTKELILERYKLVTENQRYATNLAKDTFQIYSKCFVGFATGSVALISAREKLFLGNNTVKDLCEGLLVLVVAIGVASAIQIFLCLRRWKDFRDAEIQINNACPPVPGSWWVFEGAYIFGIAIYIAIFWAGYLNLDNILLNAPLRGAPSAAPAAAPSAAPAAAPSAAPAGAPAIAPAAPQKQ